MLTIGTVLQHRYQVTAPIKTGGMGAVYEVFDQRLRATFALKEAFVQNAEERAQFEHEAQLLAQLDHAVLPRVLDHFSERGGQFLVMERVLGDDLETLLAARGQPFDLEPVLRWADQVLDALEYMHRQSPPVIHRDIKPANLKPLADGRIKLLDFGIAKSGAQTVNVAKAYSLEYSPIEQFSASTHTDARSDLYALGATLYHLLTNHAPTPATDRMRGQPLPGPQSFNPACPPALAQTMLRAMALKPEHRFQSASEFRAALQHVREQIATPPPSHRHPWWLAGAVTIVVAILGAGTLYGMGVVPLLFGSSPTPAPIGFSEVAATAPAAQLTAAVPTSAATGVATTSPTEAPTATPAPTTTPAPPVTPAVPVSTIAGFGPPGEQHPAHVTASDTAPPNFDSQQHTITYDASNAVDGQPETTWRVPGDGVGQWLMLAFEQPVRVSDVRLLPGYAKIDPYDGTNRFTQNRRVQRVRLEFSDGSSAEASFADDMRLQSVSMNPVVTTFVRIVVLQTSAPAANDGRDFTPISEVEVIGQAQLTPFAAGDTLAVRAPGGMPLREQPNSSASTVYERPLLVHGAVVKTIAQQGDWWQVQTPEGVMGWLRVAADDQSVAHAEASDPGRRFTDGAHVVVRTPKGVGIPLRAQPASTASKLRELIPDGSVLTVIGELGDWLRVRTADGAEGWGRWFYDGTQYLYAQ
jgi:serine/threonine protein kinase/SH3-like domain-containing protein